MDNNIMSARIKQRLDELGMTQVELASHIGCRPQHITDVLKGRHTMSLALAIETATALRCSLDWLVGKDA